jgi:hypothetical protein
MSAFYDTADAMAARLQADAALYGVEIVVDRQRDIASELRKSIGKQTGQGVIVITWTGGQNADENNSLVRILTNFTATGFFKPVIHRNETPADEIIEAVCKSLHGWIPETGGHFHSRVAVKGIDPIQDTELLALRVNLSCTITL